MDNQSELDKISNLLLKALEETTQKEQQELQQKQQLKAEKKKIEQQELDLRIKENESAINDYEIFLSKIKSDESNSTSRLKSIINAVSHIEELISLRNHSTYNTDRELIVKLDKIRSELIALRLKIERLGYLCPSNENEEELEDKETFKDYNKPVITRNLMAFLMSELKSNRIFISDIQDTKLAKAFSGLSGYSADQLRKTLSPVRGKSIKYSEDDKSKLKSILLKIATEIDEL